jgi:RNA polymerase primary sigma factor
VRRLEALAAGAGTLQVYLRVIAKFPRLDAEQERELGRRVREHDDQGALETLVESNLRVVVSYARRYRHLGVAYLDLIHEGNVGLIEAARRFDPARHVKFSAYSAWWIRQGIVHLLSDASDGWSRPNDRAWFHGTGHIELAERLPDGGVSAVDDETTRMALVQELETAMEELDPTERQIIRLRYGLVDDEPWTLPRIGRRLRVARARVRELESRAIQKLRRRRNLRSYLN